ncbi:hypothetical protein [Actibacterium sp. MT2.3-13A]|uniref:hypothetical protein n=1 Tax=Actibacterium sp. MT2.3-13A TaxID=2828332 RepID=UPI001BA870AB|nr:hypothetical protein [Actibacterium sp. MT2.3-13A]
MATAVEYGSPQLLEIIRDVAPRNFSRDFFGLLTGFRAFRIYSFLTEMSDAQLASLGLDRTNIARAAFDLAASDKA